MNRIAIFLLIILIASSSAVTAKDAPTDLKAKIEEMIHGSGAEIVAVAFYDLSTGKEILINADESLHAASTMKVPVMMELYRQAAAKKFSLDDRIPIKNDFISIADGSHFSI